MGQHIKLDHVPGSIKKTFQRKEIMPLNDIGRCRVDIVHTASFFTSVFGVNIPSETAKRQRSLNVQATAAVFAAIVPAA
jgi:hypothetical protein